MLALKCSRNKVANKLISAIVYLIFALLMFFLLSQKVNYNIDELLSYGLANHANGQPWFDDGVTYIPAQSPWLSYLSVQEGHAFDLRNVWENQASDVHPPFYYVILHSICSLFPGKFSMWFAGSINIVFALLTLYVVKKLAFELTEDRKVSIVVSVFFALSGGILYSALFLRMYVMTMFLVGLVTCLFLRATGLDNLSWQFYAALIMVSYIGALTHYYFIVYLFFLCLVFGIWLLYHNRYSETILFVFSMGLSACLAVITFPSMLRHVFLGGRGVESVENLQGSISDYLKRLGSFYQFVNERLLGGILTYVFIAAIFIWLFLKWVVRNNASEIFGSGTDINDAAQPKVKMIKWLLIMIPSICYYLLVSKIAVYIDARYLSPTYAVFMGWILCGIFVIGQRTLKKRYWISASGLLLAIVVVNSWRICNGDLMYRDSEGLFSRAESHAECSCLYIYDVSWKPLLSFLEISRYKSVTFFKVNNMESIADIQNLSDKEMVVCIASDSDSEEILKYILEVSPSLNVYQEIHSYGYTTSYYLYEDDVAFNSAMMEVQIVASVK